MDIYPFFWILPGTGSSSLLTAAYLGQGKQTMWFREKAEALEAHSLRLNSWTSHEHSDKLHKLPFLICEMGLICHPHGAVMTEWKPGRKSNRHRVWHREGANIHMSPPFLFPIVVIRLLPTQGEICPELGSSSFLSRSSSPSVWVFVKGWFSVYFTYKIRLRAYGP